MAWRSRLRSLGLYHIAHPFALNIFQSPDLEKQLLNVSQRTHRASRSYH